MPHKEYLRDAKGRFISAKNKHKEEEEVFPTDEKNSQLSLSFE